MTAGPQLFDSHCHLTDTAFAEDLNEVLRRARDAGVAGIVTIASGPDDARNALALANAHGDLWCTAGVHPHEAAHVPADALGRVAELVREPRVVAVGETGLDYHYDHSPRRAQRRVFDLQLDLAARTGLPVVVHSRDADEDTRDAIRGANVRGVLHCFTGGDALLDATLEADWYVSFTGLITFRNFDGADRLRRVPDSRLLVETDAPYLSPVPMRGRRNEPAFVAHTCAELARLRNVDPERMAATTTRNARAFYGLPGA